MLIVISLDDFSVLITNKWVIHLKACTYSNKKGSFGDVTPRRNLSCFLYELEILELDAVCL